MSQIAVLRALFPTDLSLCPHMVEELGNSVGVFFKSINAIHEGITLST